MDELCKCGSGRKFKNCCNKKKVKPVQHKYGYSFLNNAAAIILSNEGLKILDDQGNEIKLHNKNLSGIYERENGKSKTLFDIPNNSNTINIDPNREIIKYDTIIVIDTNTKKINNKKMSSTAIMILNKSNNFQNKVEYFEEDDSYIWESDFTDKPENYQYMETIKEISKDITKHSSNTDIAVIVDSDLENLNSFNNKELPIYEDYFMPERFKFIYASAETGQDYISNKLMKKCDKMASEFMKYFESNSYV